MTFRQLTITCAETWSRTVCFGLPRQYFNLLSHNERDHVRRVLQRLLEKRLFARMEKCNFHAWSVPFMGFILSPEGIQGHITLITAVTGKPLYLPLQQRLLLADI